MSNLSSQFDANALQVSQGIKNNKARLTRVLRAGAMELSPRKVVGRRRGQKHLSSGVEYTAQDENSTMIHWRSETFNPTNPEVREAKTQKIHDILKGAGYNVTLKDGGVHVQH
jgi:hypothetical protein